MSEVLPYDEAPQPDEVLIAEIDEELRSLERRYNYLVSLKEEIKNRHEQTGDFSPNL